MSEERSSSSNDVNLGQFIQRQDTLPKKVGGFKVIRKIGHGGMGIVLLGETERGMPVAIKILPSSLVSDSGAFQRFMRESRIATRMRHPNIVRTIKAGHETGAYYMVMEYVDGEDLGQLVREHGAIDQKIAVKLMISATRGLASAHRMGVFHRDIKPANIMISRTGEIKLADFGLARQSQGEDTMQLTMTGVIVGTPYHVSPEQIRDPRKVDARSDLYSMGTTMFQIITGVPPFAGDTAFGILKQHIDAPVPKLSDKIGDVSPDLERLVWRLMQKNPDDRLQSADELLNELKAIRQKLSARDATAAELGITDETVITSGSAAGMAGLAEVARQAGAVETDPHGVSGVMRRNEKLRHFKRQMLNKQKEKLAGGVRINYGGYLEDVWHDENLSEEEKILLSFKFLRDWTVERLTRPSLPVAVGVHALLLFVASLIVIIPLMMKKDVGNYQVKFLPPEKFEAPEAPVEKDGKEASPEEAVSKDPELEDAIREMLEDAPKEIASPTLDFSEIPNVLGPSHEDADLPSELAADFAAGDVSKADRFKFRGNAGDRDRLVAKYGHKELEARIDRALAWLASVQLPDGSWSVVKKPDAAGARSHEYSAGLTGLAVLAFAGNGHHHKKSDTYAAVVGRGLKFILSRQGKDGSFGTGRSEMYGHAICTFSLAEVYGVSRDPQLRKPIGAALEYLEKTQRASGGWDYGGSDPGDITDISVTGWAALAIKTCAELGLVDSIALPRKLANIYTSALRQDQTVMYRTNDPGSKSVTMNTVMAVVMLSMGRRGHEKFARVHRHALTVMPSDRTYYGWYYGSQVAFHTAPAEWQRWFGGLWGEVVAGQTPEGCFRAHDHHSQAAGLVYSTSMMLLAMETIFRYIPDYEKTNIPIEKLIVETMPAERRMKLLPKLLAEGAFTLQDVKDVINFSNDPDYVTGSLAGLLNSEKHRAEGLALLGEMTAHPLKRRRLMGACAAALVPAKDVLAAALPLAQDRSFEIRHLFGQLVKKTPGIGDVRFDPEKPAGPAEVEKIRAALK